MSTINRRTFLWGLAALLLSGTKQVQAQWGGHQNPRVSRSSVSSARPAFRRYTPYRGDRYNTYWGRQPSRYPAAKMYQEKDYPVPTLWHGSRLSNEIVLTFDDGPHPDLTPRLLDILRQHDLKASFYLIGENVEAYPEVAQAIAAEGHDIGNHSYTHPRLSLLSDQQFQDEILRTQEIIFNVTGVWPQTMRPPYGLLTPAQAEWLTEQNLTPIFWDVDTKDYQRQGTRVITQRTFQLTQGGSIILFHDRVDQTILSVEDIIQGLRLKGMEFVTVANMLGFEQQTVAPIAPIAQAPRTSQTREDRSVTDFWNQREEAVNHQREQIVYQAQPDTAASDPGASRFQNPSAPQVVPVNAPNHPPRRYPRSVPPGRR